MAEKENSSREPSEVTENSATKSSQSVIRWDSSRMRSTHPDAFKLSVTREEIVLLFGVSQSRGGGQQQATVQLSNAIALSPFTAKRLVNVLNKVIRDYESRYGPLKAENGSPDEKLIVRNVQTSLNFPLRLPPFETAKAAEQVVLLFEILKNLKAMISFERSFKIFEKTLLGSRFLLAFKPESIRQNPHEKILAMGVRMGMSREFLDLFEKDLPEATSVGFGIEENEEACVVKAYLEFRKRYQEALGRGADFHSYVSHLGFKWDAADNRRGALARYACFPRFTAGHILERLSKAFYTDCEHAFPFKTLKGIVDLGSRKVGPDKFLYIEVNEGNNPRSSFDINMYGADLRLQELSPFFMEMCRHYSIPDEQFKKLYEPVRTQIFGHLAGGRDRKGRDFLTVYFSEE